MLFAGLASLHSCSAKTDTGLLLQGHEYKLWHICSEDKDSLEWMNLDVAKLQSFWIQYKDEDEFINDTDRDSEHACYTRINPKKGINIFQIFKKKRKAPEFLYIDRDGYSCVLALNRETGDFVEKQEAEMTGTLKVKNDSILIINNNRYLYRKTGRNPDTVQIRNLQTGNEIKIIDANIFPGLSGHKINWTEKEETFHREKWGFGIKQSPLLQGFDSKLWRKEEKFCRWSSLDCGTNFISEDIDYISRSYYYCQFMYFDRYGRYAHLYLTGDKWRIMETDCYDEICCSDDVVLYGWRPNGNDSTLLGPRTVQILPAGNADTLHLRDLETNEMFRYIAIHLPPKSKNKKFKK
jgi:hypothetical protein